MCMWLGSPCRYYISDLWKWWVYSNLKIKYTVNSWFYVFHCFFLNLDLSFIQMDLDSWPHNWDRVCSPEIHVWLGLALLQPIISGLLDAIRESWKGETWKCNEDHRKHEFDSLYAFSVGLGNHLTIVCWSWLLWSFQNCCKAMKGGLPGRKIHVGSCCRSVSRRTSRAFGGNGMIPHLTDEEAAQRCSGRLLQLAFYLRWFIGWQVPIHILVTSSIQFGESTTPECKIVCIDGVLG